MFNISSPKKKKKKYIYIYIYNLVFVFPIFVLVSYVLFRRSVENVCLPMSFYNFCFSELSLNLGLRLCLCPQFVLEPGKLFFEMVTS